ncbi:MAG: Uncharacterized protein CEN87_756 [Parcubacteria group bacterium Licking1014_1]|nr:MAG: Uncharacterized protein CEN87_756 [Parcubacteria group bacterium Licking1014_1]
MKQGGSASSPTTISIANLKIMSRERILTILLVFFGLAASVFFAYLPVVALASIIAGTIDSSYKYAWGDSSGWINFKADQSNIIVYDDRLTGYAWSEMYGWINLAPDGSGVTNNREGTLSGYAFGENAGWINFSGVTISSGGQFAGTASGDVTGTISFDCSGCVVKTDWRPVSVRTGGPATGPLPPYPAQPASPAGPAPDTEKPVITITKIKDKYNPEEEIIIGGTTESDSEVSLNLNGAFGLFSAGSSGEWLITLGKRPLGKYTIEFTAKDLAGNLSDIATVEFVVESGAEIEQPGQPGIIERIREELKKIIPPLFKPEEKLPKPVVTVPKISPVALGGKWRIFPVKPINLFVLSPLPSQIKMLAQKFPQLAETFEKVGVSKITDVKKIKAADLVLPGLTQTLGLASVEITPGKFAPPKGIPIAELTSQMKQKIPSDIIFAKAGGELIDYNIALSLNDKGNAEQRITTIAGASLDLVVKPDRPVKKVRGYIIFKSKKISPTSFKLPLNYLAASLMFAGPNLSKTQEKPVEVEQRLVLVEFEYEDVGDGVYRATVQAPIVDGEYEIITVMDYQDSNFLAKEIRLITVVDPEGYIFEKDGNKETRISGAIAQLYWLNQETKQYELWPAKNFQQENPQSTDVRGTYSFLVPEGYYYLKVEAPGYLSYDGKPFEVKEGSGIHFNIEMKTRYWWLKIADWKTVLLIIVILMLLYNFYRDRMRERFANKINPVKM